MLKLQRSLLNVCVPGLKGFNLLCPTRFKIALLDSGFKGRMYIYMYTLQGARFSQGVYNLHASFLH